jgi:dihydroflavonol-4-reductase
MAERKNNILVTGGTGLLGSHLLFALAVRGENPVAIFRNESKKELAKKVFGYYSDDPEALFNSVKWINADISEGTAMKELIKGFDLVYHCAAEVSFDPSENERIIHNNVLLTKNIVTACFSNNVPKLCHVSSVAALGARGGRNNITESQIWDEYEAHSAYAISKHKSEEIVWEYIRKGLNAVIVNPTVIFGPGDWNRGSSQYFSRIRKGMPFYTKGITGYVDVRDVVKAMISLTMNTVSGERFIISSENISFHEIFTTIAENIGKNPPYLYMPESLAIPATVIIKAFSALQGKRPAITKENIRSAYSCQYFDNSKAKEVTGIDFIPVRKSIEDTCKIYLNELND